MSTGDWVVSLARKTYWLELYLFEGFPGGKDEAILKLGIAGQLPGQRPYGAALDLGDTRKCLQCLQVARVLKLSLTGRRDEYRLHRQFFFFEVLFQLAGKQVAR